jgi:hypothetical protein
MLDDLRNTATTPQGESIPPEDYPESIPAQRTQVERGSFLGMTAPQRFVIVLMLLFMTCILGSFCLLVSDKVVLPFF